MKNKNLKSIFKQLKEKIAHACDTLEEKTRALLIIFMGILLGSGSVIAIVQSIYLIDKNSKKEKLPIIEHVTPLELISKDSINSYNFTEHEPGREFKKRESE